MPVPIAVKIYYKGAFQAVDQAEELTMLRFASKFNRARGCVGCGIAQLGLQLGPQLCKLLQVLL